MEIIITFVFVHEIGHCFHNELMKEQKPSLYRIPQMETAEFASITMEYLTLDHWREFYLNDEDYRRARKMQLEGFITFLSSGIVIDLFQHWLYENPKHTVTERNSKYIEMAKQFYAHSIDYTGMEQYLSNRWRTARHVFESPFYSIEYIIANIAAVEMYRQSKIDKEGTFKRFKKALSLGSSKSMLEVYEIAGVSLHVTEDQLKQLVEFVKSELNDL
jgi:oligoendopeptidase F